MGSTRKNGNERRRFSRIAYHRPADLELAGARIACQVLDLSLKGALLEVPADLRGRVGEPGRLTIQLDEAGEARIRMEGHLAHHVADHVGFRCDELDLESLQHLRRFVELNLGDEEILHRELSALIARRER